MFDDVTCTDSEFGERIGAKLRSPEKLKSGFEERVMQSVRMEGPLNQRPNYLHIVMDWATEKRSIQVSPIAGLAIAAGFAGIIALATLRVNTPASQMVSHDNLQPIQFVISAPTASTVNLVGDFNDWNVSATPLQQASAGAPGIWTINVPLQPGRHEYSFVVDGKIWITDPAAPETIENDFGQPNSVVTVGDKSA